MAGLAIIHSPHAPTEPMVLDSTQLGGMADEASEGPGLRRVSDLAVQIKSIRDDSRDKWDIQGRRLTVPIIQEPAAACSITGAESPDGRSDDERPPLMPPTPPVPETPAYVVTAKLAIFRTQTPDGPRLRNFYQGSPVPSDAPPEQIEHHLRKGMIAKVDAKAAGPQACRRVTGAGGGLGAHARGRRQAHPHQDPGHDHARVRCDARHVHPRHDPDR